MILFLFHNEGFSYPAPNPSMQANNFSLLHFHICFHLINLITHSASPGNKKNQPKQNPVSVEHAAVSDLLETSGIAADAEAWDEGRNGTMPEAEAFPH